MFTVAQSIQTSTQHVYFIYGIVILFPLFSGTVKGLPRRFTPAIMNEIVKNFESVITIEWRS